MREEHQNASAAVVDNLRNYRNIVQYLFVLQNYMDGVKGDGKRMAQIL